jgi:23S rRNA (pseudouridine1915-N3)-methyltransferase
MKTTLILVGKTTDKHIAALIDDYTSRLQHYAPFEMTVIPELKNTKSLSEQQQKQAEGELILRQLQPSDHVVLLDERGKTFRSVKLAAWMTKKQQAAQRRLVFVVGGPYGFSEDVYRRANEQLSLSPMTFSHQMVRLVFVEQLYRAHTIIKGEPYHHE